MSRTSISGVSELHETDSFDHEALDASEVHAGDDLGAGADADADWAPSQNYQNSAAGYNALVNAAIGFGAGQATSALNSALNPTAATTYQQVMSGQDCWSTAVDLGYKGKQPLAAITSMCNANPKCRGFRSNGGMGGDWWLLSGVAPTGRAASANVVCFAAAAAAGPSAAQQYQSNVVGAVTGAAIGSVADYVAGKISFSAIFDPKDPPPTRALKRQNAIRLKQPKGAVLAQQRIAKVLDGAKIVSSFLQLFVTGEVPFCWRQNVDRGLQAKPLNSCPAGTQNIDSLCYQQCPPDKPRRIGLTCYANCPAGYRDDGLYCAKPSSYGRGSGYTWFDRKKCHNCEKWGAMYYPKCRDGFRAAGCCVCSPSCPSGFEDIGVSCKKPSMNLGVGRPLQCPAGSVMPRGTALCYPPCAAGFHDELMWCRSDCPATQPFNCGLGCTTDQMTCTAKVFDQTLAPLMVVANVASFVLSGGTQVCARGGALSRSCRRVSFTCQIFAKSRIREFGFNWSRFIPPFFNSQRCCCCSDSSCQE